MTGSDLIALGALALAGASIAKDFFLERLRAKRALELKMFEAARAADLKKYEIAKTADLKEYEVTFLQKRQGFADLFDRFRQAYVIARAHGEQNQLTAAFGAEANALHGLMPFLPKADHTWLAHKASEIEDRIRTNWDASGNERDFFDPTPVDDYVAAIDSFRSELFGKLFAD